jgi:hypothetical protein
MLHCSALINATSISITQDSVCAVVLTSSQAALAGKAVLAV